MGIEPRSGFGLALAAALAVLVADFARAETPAPSPPPATPAVETGLPALACKEALTSAVRRDHPRVRQVEWFVKTLRQFKVSDAETGVSGAGRYLPEAGVWQPYTFNCVYNDSKATVVAVHYRTAPAEPARPDVAALCEQAVRDKIAIDLPKLRTISVRTVLVRDRGVGEIETRGDARAQTKAGAMQFTFHCVWDRNSRRSPSVTYNLERRR